MQLSGVSWNWHSRRSLSALFFCEFYSCLYIGAISWSFVPAKSSSAIFCVKVYKGKELRRREMIRIFFFLPPPSVSHPSSLSFFCSTLFFFQSPVTTKAVCKRTQHCWMLHHVVFVCTPLTFKFTNLKPVKLLATCKRTQQNIRDIIIRMSE